MNFKSFFSGVTEVLLVIMAIKYNLAQVFDGL